MRFPRSLAVSVLVGLAVGCSAPQGFRTYEQLTDKEKEKSSLLKAEMFNFLARGYDFLAEENIEGAMAMADSADTRVRKIIRLARFPGEFCPPELSEFRGDMFYSCRNFGMAAKEYENALELYRLLPVNSSEGNGVLRIMDKMNRVSFFEEW